MSTDKCGYNLNSDHHYNSNCNNECIPCQDGFDIVSNVRGSLSYPESSRQLSQEPRRNCCCKKSLIEALKLLCNSDLAEVIDFDKFAFLTENFIVGARLVLLKIGSEDKDNLSNLDGKFKRFLPCNCDLIEIEGTVSYDVPLPLSIKDLAEQITELIHNIIDILGEQTGILGTVVDVLKEFLKIFDPLDFSKEILQAILDFLIKYFTTIPVVDTASLCAIHAVAFQVKYVGIQEAADTTRDKQTEENYQRAKKILRNNLYCSCQEECGECHCKCKCDACCCADSILNEFLNTNLSRTATLTAGNLTLRDVTVLGAIGDVLVFANDIKRRFYLVCANSVQFLD